MILSRDRNNSLISCRKRLFIFHLTLKIIIKRERVKENEQQRLKYKIEKVIVKKSAVRDCPMINRSVLVLM